MEKKKKKKGFTLIELLAVIIILGVLMIIAIPSVTEYIGDSRRKAYITTAGQYVGGARNKVNSLEYSFLDEDTTYYVPINCIPLEKGGESPFGEWRDAYVIVTYNGSDGFDYYWTSLDSSGYKVEITHIDDLNVDSLIPSSNELNSRIGIDGRKWVAVVDKDTCEVGTPFEAEENYGDQILANVVSIGDFVNYDAGVWDTTVAKPTSGFSFGGYTSGKSRNNSVSCSGETSLYNGWRVLSVDGDVIKLIHAGSSECYYHSRATNSGCASSYVLLGKKQTLFGCQNLDDSFYDGYQIRDWSDYLDSRYATNVSSVSWVDELDVLWSETNVKYTSAQDFVRDHPDFDFVLTDSRFSNVEYFLGSDLTDLVDNGARGKYWLGLGHLYALHKQYNNVIYKNFGDDRLVIYGYYLGDYSKALGVRPVVTFKARIKTSGQVEQVVGTNGTTKAMVWQLIEE